MIIKEKIKKLKQSHFIVGRLIFLLLNWCWLLTRFFVDQSYRSIFLTKIQFGNNYHQQALFTALNRYPLIFQACAKYLSSVKEPHILSFGCSTGEEVFSIGQYLPNAKILGVDINQWCLKKCYKKYSNQNFSFVHRLSDKFKNADDFDAIFCMAVFQRTENRTSQINVMSQGYFFNKFEEEITLLDKKLKKGGLFVIDHSDYSFLDTKCSMHYFPLSFENNQLYRKRPLFDKYNQKVANSHYSFRVFVKS